MMKLLRQHYRSTITMHINSAKQAIVWSRDRCAFCDMAVMELGNAGYQVEVRKIGSPWTIDQLRDAVPGAKSVPQIFIEDTYIGSYTHLRNYLDGNV